MTLALLCLLVLAGFLAGAGVALYLVEPPVSEDQRHIDDLARRDRSPRVLP